jgi:hypothetical protein
MVVRDQEGLQEYRPHAYLYRPIAHRIPSTACTQATAALLETFLGLLADGLIRGEVKEKIGCVFIHRPLMFLYE